MSDAPYRPMKYPYTLTAKLVQFPHKYYWKHSWLYRYMFYSILISAPLFYKIQKLSYSPPNVEKWQKTWKEQFSGSGGHH